MNHSLEVDSIILEFGNKRILQDIYIHSETGIITGIIGKNGTGKTCLMRIIYGELDITNKSIRLNGETLLNGVQNLDAFHYLPQFNFIPKNRRTKSIFKDFSNDFSEFLEYFPEFKKYYHFKIGRLSEGEKRIIEIYNIIKAKSKFCMLDEPFSQVMPVHVETIKEIIVQEKRNKGMIITDHLYEHILNVSDRLYLLHKGKTHLVNSVHDLEVFGYVSENDNKHKNQ